MNMRNTSSRAATGRYRLARLGVVAALLGSAAAGALAQYKIVGPDGHVTYTDKPPTAAQMQAPGNGTPSATTSTGGLPYETRQAMAKYPVTLFAAKSCQPCDSARQALRQRGVPFNEYSVNTDADIAALQSRFGSPTAPVILIGNQPVIGYSAQNVAGYLDAAGYPAQARLIGYSWPPAQPLTSPAPVAAPAAEPAPSAPLLPPPSKSGIQF